MTTYLIENADVRTMTTSKPPADAIAWRDGNILAVGARDDVAHAAGRDATRVDARGATVLPGFVDAHHHPSLVALWGGTVRLAPPLVRDVATLQSTLRAAAARLAPGQWLLASDWNEELLAEKRAPTRAELDDAVPHHPLLAMNYTCHRAVVNSRALELAGIDRHTPDPAGGAISRGRDGLPDGLLIERGMSRVESLARADAICRDAEGFFERIRKHHDDVLAAGITTMADATVPLDLLDLYREAERRGALRVPTIAFPVSTSGYLETPLDVVRGDPPDNARDAILSVGPVKLVFDGAPVCAMCLSWWQLAGTTVRTWALAVRRGSLDPLRVAMQLAPKLGAKIRTGIHIYDREEARATVRAAADRGWPVAIHAIGNAAIDIALDAMEAAGPKLHDRGRARLEHASFVDRALVARIAGNGAFVVAQPHFVTLPAVDSAPSIPGLRYFAHRWLLDAGVPIAGSSDHPVAGFHPLDGIRSAIGRRTGGGFLYDADQAIDLDDALAMYTRVAADACGVLDRCGTLESGKRANLVVLDARLSPSTLPDVRVRATVLDGVPVAGTLDG